MLEKTIEKKVVEEAKRLWRAWGIKITPRGFVGLPDRMFLFPGGRICFVEFKAPGKKPSAIQNFVIGRLRRMGFRVFVCDDVRRGIEQLRTFAEA